MLPLAPGRDQRPPSLGRQAVDPPPGPASLGRLIVPLGGDQPPALQTVKRRINRALLERQGSAARGIEPAADVPAMRRAVLKHGQNQALEMPPQLVSADGFHTQYLDRLSSGVKGIAWKRCDGEPARESGGFGGEYVAVIQCNERCNGDRAEGVGPGRLGSLSLDGRPGVE